MSSLDVGLSALSFMFYVFFRSKTERFVFNVFSSLDVGLKWFVFYVLHPVWT